MTVRRNYRTLDAVVVAAVLIIMLIVFVALIFRNIPQPNLPILSGLAGTVFGATVGAYCAARWGNAPPPTQDASQAD